MLDPPHEMVGPPAEIGSAKVSGYCATVVTGFDGSVWSLPPGSVDGQLRRVDAASVDRGAAECQQ